MVPFAPGGGTDVVARTLAQEMAKSSARPSSSRTSRGRGPFSAPSWSRPVRRTVYTLLMGTFANAVNPSLNAKLPYDAHKDFAAVALLARSFNIVVVNPASPIKSIGGPDRRGKGRAAKLTYGTYGTGTSAHLAGELFASTWPGSI